MKQGNSITLDVSIYLEGIHRILILQSKAMNLHQGFTDLVHTVYAVFVLVLEAVCLILYRIFQISP